MCSIYEYLYSFRETVDSPMPDFNSERAIEALKKFNKIKNATTSSNKKIIKIIIIMIIIIIVMFIFNI